MKLRKYIPFILLILTLGCEKGDEKVEIETEKIVNGRILFSENNLVPENLKVLSLDGITELGINTNLDLPSSSNELEFLLTDDNQLLFVRKKHPNLNDVKLSSESTVLFLCTYNSAYYKLDDSNKNIIVNQVLNNPNFISAKNILDNSTSINLSDENFKQKIQEIITQIYSVENLALLSRNQMPLLELTTIYTAFDNILSIKNNADIHVGFSITKDGNPFDDGLDDGLLDGQEQEDITITDVNAVYHIKSNSGADISGVFNDNDLEEIEAFNADFRKFLFDSFIVLAQLAVPTIDNDCFEPIFDSAIDAIDFAEEYGNNNVAPDVLVEAFLDIQPTIAELLSDGVQCVGVNSTILEEIFEVFNVINDIINAANFLNDQLNVISQYIQFENSEYDCYYKVETVFYECDNPTVGEPTGPVPLNNAENVPVNGTFSFSLGDNTPDYAAFKIYTGLSTNLTNFTITNSTFNQYSNLQQGTTYYWKVEVINPATDQILSTSNTWSFTTIGTSDTIPSLSTTSITNITETSASSGGNVTNDGGSNVTAKGICWSTNQNPTTNNDSTNNGTGTGTFTSSLTNLNPNTTYYVRAYATNNEGTAYGNQQTFTTDSSNNSTPTVTTSSITNVTETSASSGGNVTNDGGNNVTARGICWSTNQNPTTSNNSTNNGTGTGTFTSSLSNLNSNTTYYVRAYATNSEGTSYGSQEIFTTSNNSSQPNLVFSDFRIDGDDNNNEIVEAGEDIDLDIQVQNIGNATANNVDVYFDTNDSDINISDHSQGYGDVTHGSYDWNSGNLDFQVSADCPTKTVTFTVTFSSDEGTWNDSFTINVQGSSGGNPISITPADDDCSAPLMQVNQEYEININVSNYGSAIPIDGESSGGGNVRGFWLSFYVPSGTTVNDVKIYDVSNNFDPVIGTRTNCTFTNYLPDITTTNYYNYANQNGIGGNETFRNNFVGDSGSNNDGVYYVRIYHYYGNETPSISFKMIVE